MLTLENQSENTVYIEGILSEINLEVRDGYTNKRTGGTQRGITGTINVQLEQAVDEDSEPKLCDIAISCFAFENKKNGGPNPAFESLSKVMNEYKSIAAVGIDEADRVRISGASLSLNRYEGRDGREVRYPRIRATFINRISKEQYHPRATFTVTAVVGQKMREQDANGEETGKYIVNGSIVQWGGLADVLQFCTSNENAIDYIEATWEPGDTVKMEGLLMFTSQEVEASAGEVDYGFGTPTNRTRTVFKSDLVIVAGSAPLDEDLSYDLEEIKRGIALADDKYKADMERRKNRATSTSAPTKTSKDLGF